MSVRAGGLSAQVSQILLPLLLCGNSLPGLSPKPPLLGEKELSWLQRLHRSVQAKLVRAAWKGLTCSITELPPCSSSFSWGFSSPCYCFAL